MQTPEGRLNNKMHFAMWCYSSHKNPCNRLQGLNCPSVTFKRKTKTRWHFLFSIPLLALTAFHYATAGNGLWKCPFVEMAQNKEPRCFKELLNRWGPRVVKGPTDSLCSVSYKNKKQTQNTSLVFPCAPSTAGYNVPLIFCNHEAIAFNLRAGGI